MEQFEQHLTHILDDSVQKFVFSKPIPNYKYKRSEVVQKNTSWQLTNYTDTQVFHKNFSQKELFTMLCTLSQQYRQINAWSATNQWDILVSKKGKITCKKHLNQTPTKLHQEHNRQKQYLIQEGNQVPPLIDMGIFTKDGKVVKSMYDKFRQINRFLEMIEDELRIVNPKTLNIIDFGCGKSYLTFVLYYYLTEIKGIDANIIGLDLKKSVIEKCNQAAARYGYNQLQFQLGDIQGYQAPFSVDMVVTLHACDTATDHALFHAIEWGANMIFSVPCCQHQLNSQMESKQFSILTRYGIVKERIASLMTDTIRANLLEYCGYKTQLLEFVDFSHTPKNILIRSMKKNPTPLALRKRYLQEVTSLMNTFNFCPELYQLLQQAGYLPKHS